MKPQQPIRKLVQLLCVIAVAAATAAPAAAQVRYDFEAFSSSPFQGAMISGSFSVISPAFISSNTDFAVSDLLSCTVVANPPAPLACSFQQFVTTVGPSSLVQVVFGFESVNNQGAGRVYYFEDAAFTTPGVYETVLLGQEQAGRLTVTAVPEPAAAASLLLGLAALGTLARHRRST